MKIKTLTIAAAISVALVGSAEARDQIRIVGSSTVFPFSTAVAEQFGKASNFSTPVVESTGTGGGMKLFCSGIGEDHPDVTNASRRMKKSEFDNCTKNGIDITEVKVGFDGIVLANAKSGADLDLTLEQLFLALAKEVPQGGKLVANPYTNWSEIDPSLPNLKIEVPRPAADERHARRVRRDRHGRRLQEHWPAPKNLVWRKKPATPSAKTVFLLKLVRTTT